MYDYLTKGIFVGFVINIVKSVCNLYDKSVLKKCMKAVSQCCLNSCVHRIFHNYVYKKPYFESSLIYRLICFIAHIADCIFGGINRFLIPALSNSKIYSFVLRIKNLGKGNITYLAGILLMSIPIGSIASMILTDSVVFYNMVVSWIIFAAGMVVVMCGIFFSAFAESIPVRLIRKFTDIILG